MISGSVCYFVEECSSWVLILEILVHVIKELISVHFMVIQYEAFSSQTELNKTHDTESLSLWLLDGQTISTVCLSSIVQKHSFS